MKQYMHAVHTLGDVNLDFSSRGRN